GLAAAEETTPEELRANYSRSVLLRRYRFHLSNQLHETLGLSRAELDRKLVEPERPVIDLVKNLEEDQYRELDELFATKNLGGLGFRREIRRFYPSNHRLTHVLGFVDSRNVGKEGIEGKMDHILRGEEGERRVRRDSRGREITAYRIEERPARNGRDVHLSIDMGLQELVERSLERAVRRYRPEKICAIWMQPQTGEILALANRPHFDLSTREGDRRNFAVQDTYEPGSTFKIVALGGAMERELISPESMVFCHNGKFEEAGYVLTDSHPHDRLSVREVMAKSSNVGAYQIARQLGKSRFYDAVNGFGFNRKTRLHLTGEAGGLIKHPDQWSVTSFSRMAIGYEVSITPLQMLNALGVIANGGELLRPRVVGSVDETPTVRMSRSRTLSPQTAKKLTSTLVAVTKPGGTAERAQVPGFTVAGKTGTARKHSEAQKSYVEGHYVVSFMGFLPAEKPELMGIVVFFDTQGGFGGVSGGTIAAPIFAEMAQQAVAYLNLQPNTSLHSFARTWN
ncbi:MAG: penicillin-binding protein 2, partial [Verrucomicrobiota bacterium]